MMLMGFQLHAVVVLDRNAVGRLMCRERMSRLTRVTLVLHGEYERRSLLYYILHEYNITLTFFRSSYLLATNNLLMGRECGDDIGVEGEIRGNCMQKSLPSKSNNEISYNMFQIGQIDQSKYLKISHYQVLPSRRYYSSRG